jgi:hypothetical protein
MLPNVARYCSQACYFTSRRLFSEALADGTMEIIIRLKRRALQRAPEAERKRTYASEARLRKNGYDPERLREIRELGAPLES